MSDWERFMRELFTVLDRESKPQRFVALVRGDGTHDCPVCECLRCASEKTGGDQYPTGDQVDDETMVNH